MFFVLSAIEKIFRGVRIFFKLFYYKVKYGKRIKIGRKVHFRKGFVVNISKNGRLVIGNGTFFNNDCSINCHKKIIIGKNNLFGEGVKLYDHNHVFNDKSINMKKSYNDRSITIGDRNWFGSNVVILSKAVVGDNNVFGCNVVVNGKYGSDEIVKQNMEYTIKKINYRIGS